MTELFDDPVRFLARLILQIPALLVAVTVHELAHALVADRLGDPTPRRLGRITLNPLPHIDPLGALAFVLAGFGWAKPVPVSARYLRHPTRDMAWVAAAGPVTNFLVAFVALVALRVLSHVGGPVPFVSEPLTGVLFWTYVFNLALGIFNLIPLPPLDGDERPAAGVVATTHPSAVLRADNREPVYAAMVADLRVAAEALAAQ